MRKLTLRMDTLQVESFELAEGRGEKRGTVRAHDASDSACCYYPQATDLCHIPPVMTGYTLTAPEPAS